MKDFKNAEKMVELLLKLVDAVPEDKQSEATKEKKEELLKMKYGAIAIEELTDSLTDDQRLQMADVLDDNTHLIIGVYAKDIEEGTAIGFGVYDMFKQQAPEIQMHVLKNFKNQIDKMIATVEDHGSLDMDKFKEEYEEEIDDCDTCEEERCPKNPGHKKNIC